MIDRYARARFRALWSDERRLEAWLEVELAALDAWSELGVVPRRRRGRDDPRARRVDVARVGEIERRTHHDVLAFTESIAEQVGPEARWFHYGLTSSDVVDTGLALVLREAGELLLAGIDRALDAVRARAEEYRFTPCMGRTHGVHAEPTTFGLKLLGRSSRSIATDERLAARRRGRRGRQALGCGRRLRQRRPAGRDLALERLGLEPEPAATQVVGRDRHAHFLAALAVLAGGLDRFAVEIRHLQRSEVREAAEPFATRPEGLLGDAAQAQPDHLRAHLRARPGDPCERGRRASRTQPLWHERDISHSSAERVVLADSTTLCDYLLDRFAWVVEGMQVYPARMLRNIEGSFGLTFSGRVLLALVESGLTRERAYELVQRNAHARVGGRVPAAACSPPMPTSARRSPRRARPRVRPRRCSQARRRRVRPPEAARRSARA